MCITYPIPSKETLREEILGDTDIGIIITKKNRAHNRKLIFTVNDIMINVKKGNWNKRTEYDSNWNLPNESKYYKL